MVVVVEMVVEVMVVVEVVVCVCYSTEDELRALCFLGKHFIHSESLHVYIQCHKR